MQYAIAISTVEDHKDMCALAKLSKYTNSFSSHMFSPESAYQKGWITHAIDPATGDPVGLLCVRHKVRQPETMIYFMVVHPDHRKSGVGAALIRHLKRTTPHRKIALSVMNDNEGGQAFWRSFGFEKTGDAYKGKGIQMTLNLDNHS